MGLYDKFIADMQSMNTAYNTNGTGTGFENYLQAKGVTPEAYGTLPKVEADLLRSNYASLAQNPDQLKTVTMQPGLAGAEANLGAGGTQPSTTSLAMAGLQGVGTLASMYFANENLKRAKAIDKRADRAESLSNRKSNLVQANLA